MIPIGGYLLLVRITYGPMISLVLSSAVLSFFKAVGISLLPAAIIILIAESFSVRAEPAYVVVGVSVLLGCTSYLVMREGLAFNFADLSGMTSAGIVAGLVYWRIPGRDAGAWRGFGNRS